MKKYILLLLTVFLFACSTKKNTSLSRGYQRMTTKYNVLFNAKESYKEGIRKVINGHKRSYSELLPIYLSQDENARAAAFSDMDRAAVKAMKAIKLHSITVKPRRKNKITKAYIKFRKKNEYNDLIDDCYLLKGKADYYNKKYQLADKSFKFIIKKFSNEDIVYEARIWYVRSLVEQNKFTQINEQIRFLNKNGLPEKYRSDVFLVSAYYYLNIHNYRLVIENIERATNLLKRKEKAYYLYLLAQVYQQEGKSSMAMDLFSRIEKMPISYEMGFNAKISKAISFSGSANQSILNELNKLLREKKNKDYRDQIYYAIGNVSMKIGNEDEAVKNYWKSTRVSVDNDVQRSTSFRSLADYYYKNLSYEESFLCYDSCLFYNSSLSSKFKSLKLRYENLSYLIQKINIVNRQDSLLSIARMTESERNKIIDKKIQKVKDDRAFLMEQKNKADLDRSFYNQSQINNTSIKRNGSTSGAWYFYNVSLVASGKSEFVRKWGRRRLEDNWNRKNKAIVDIVDDKELIDDIGIDEKNNVDLLGDPMTRKTYLRDIPMTKESQQLADSLILESLFSIGELYSDVLNDYKSALRVYENMIKRYPSNKYLLYVYFSCYNCAIELSDYSLREKYKKMIISEFPTSEYAKLVNSPSYINEMKNNLSKEDNLYQRAFELYDKGDFVNCSVMCNKAINDYPYSALKDKFMLLKIYSVGRTMPYSDLKLEIDKLLKANKNSDLSLILAGIKKNLDAGGVVDKDIVIEEVDDKVEVSSKRYIYDEKARHYFVLTFPRTGKNLNMLNYRLNVLCGESLEQSVLEVKREMFGMEMLMYVVSVLKDKNEGDELLDIMLRDKRLANELEDLDFRMFTISSTNYKTLKLRETMDEYLKFYSENYFESKDLGLKMIGTASRSDMLFKLEKSLNHKLVMIYPYKNSKVDYVALLKSYDPDFEVRTEEFDSVYQAVIVDNIGSSKSAMKYLSGAQKYFLDKKLDLTKFMMVVITNRNYELMYEHKYRDEYLDFFKTNYKHIIDKEKKLDEYGFSYKESIQHLYVLVYSNKVNEKKLLSAFKKYNSKNFLVESFIFDEKRNILIVEKLANKKKGMIYYRAVRSNKELYRALRKTSYDEFIISKTNYDILSNFEMIQKYKSLFSKWYLN